MTVRDRVQAKFDMMGQGSLDGSSNTTSQCKPWRLRFNRVPGILRRDEIGVMARAVEILRKNAIAADAMETAARSDRLARERQQIAMDRHTQDFGVSIAAVMGDFAASAENMRAFAESIGGVGRQQQKRHREGGRHKLKYYNDFVIECGYDTRRGLTKGLDVPSANQARLAFLCIDQDRCLS